jgi:hypothetical protein
MLVTTLLTIHNQLKVYHWQTKGKGSYAQHQALGGAYDAFTGLIDEFIEVFMGKYGRVQGPFDIKLENFGNGVIESFVDKSVNYLIDDLPKELDAKKDTDLLNIRDEMLSELNKLKYLLTLE